MASSFSTPVGDARDDQFLSEHGCYIRSKCMEYFATTVDDDVMQRGRCSEITEGRVGIRCVFCKDLPNEERAPQSCSFPNRISAIHTSVSMLQTRHFARCQAIPKKIRKKMKNLCRQKNVEKPDKFKTSDHLQDCIVKKGLVDDPEYEGVRVKDGFSKGKHFDEDESEDSESDEDSVLPWECGCGLSHSGDRVRCGKCKKWKGGHRPSPLRKYVETDSSGDEDDDDDDDGDIILTKSSRGRTLRRRVEKKEVTATLNNNHGSSESDDTRKKKSSRTTSGRTFVEPKSLGDVGFSFRKKFNSGWYTGEVIEIRYLAENGHDRRCLYSDGDVEDLTLEDLKQLAKLDPDNYKTKSSLSTDKKKKEKKEEKEEQVAGTAVTALFERTRHELLNGRDFWMCTTCGIGVPSLTMPCGKCNKYISFVPLEVREFEEFVKKQMEMKRRADMMAAEQQQEEASLEESSEEMSDDEEMMEGENVLTDSKKRSRSSPNPCGVPSTNDPEDSLFFLSLHSNKDKGKINAAHIPIRRDVLQVRRTVSGRVFFQCGCCSHVTRQDRARLSTVAPKSIEGLYRAFGRFFAHHVPHCQYIPKKIKSMAIAPQNNRGSKDYWTTSANAIGLKDGYDCIVYNGKMSVNTVTP